MQSPQLDLSNTFPISQKPLINSNSRPYILKRPLKQSLFSSPQGNVHGFKYYSKLLTVGEQTPQALKNIRKSANIKFVPHFEFDAYLCKSSNIKELSRTLSQLKGCLTSVTLIIRRVDEKNETDILAPFLYKILRLKKLRLEFPGTEHIDEKGAKVLAKAMRKCYTLRSTDIRLISMPSINQRGFKEFTKRFPKLLKMNDLTFYPYGFFTPENEFENQKMVVKRKVPLKAFYLKNANRTGWTAMCDDRDDLLPILLESFGNAFLELHTFIMIFHKMPISTESVHMLSSILPKMKELHKFTLEFCYCKIGELDLMLLVEGLRRAYQFKKLTFKLTEYSSLNSSYLLEFVRCVSKLEFLEQYDLFFRKLRYSAIELQELSDSLLKMKDLHFVITKESLHIYKQVDAEPSPFSLKNTVMYM